VGKDRSFTITNGKVVTFIDNPPKGYGLIELLDNKRAVGK
jgi:hypothetical protein